MSAYNLDICRQCENKGFDMKTGIICKLTQAKPEFIVQCDSFVQKITQEKFTRSFTTYDEDRATGWQRFFNYVIDRIIILVLSAILGIFLGLSGYTNISRLEDYLYTSLIVLFYYTLIESITGQSIGKLITGTVVVTKDGEKPDFINIVGRTLCRFIPFNAFSFLGEDHSGWHDSISNTKVIKKSAYKGNSKYSELLDGNL